MILLALLQHPPSLRLHLFLFGHLTRPMLSVLPEHGPLFLRESSHAPRHPELSLFLLAPGQALKNSRFLVVDIGPEEGCLFALGLGPAYGFSVDFVGVVFLVVVKSHFVLLLFVLGSGCDVR